MLRLATVLPLPIARSEQLSRGGDCHRPERLCRASRQHAGRARRRFASHVVAAQQGGGVLDKPAVVPTRDPGQTRLRRRPGMYRTMLHNDNTNRREYVVTVLLKVIDGMTTDDAIVIMQEAHQNGLACVIVCPQEDAERYCEELRGNGLVSSVEPHSGGKDVPD